MDSKILDKCVQMMDSGDPEMMELGKVLFLQHYPTLTDLFVLDMRIRPVEDDSPGCFDDIIDGVNLPTRSKQEKMLREIRDEIWGRAL